MDGFITFERGRGVLNVRQQCALQVSQLREYLYNKQNAPLHNNICEEVNGYTPLNLADPNCQNIRNSTLEQLAMEWREKSLYGQHPLVQDQPNVDIETFNLCPETEGCVVAIQDKVIGNRNYQKHILRYNIGDKCRLCGNPNDAIENIIDDCRILAQRE